MEALQGTSSRLRLQDEIEMLVSTIEQTTQSMNKLAGMFGKIHSSILYLPTYQLRHSLSLTHPLTCTLARSLVCLDLLFFKLRSHLCFKHHCNTISTLSWFGVILPPFNCFNSIQDHPSNAHDYVVKFLQIKPNFLLKYNGIMKRHRVFKAPTCSVHVLSLKSLKETSHGEEMQVKHDPYSFMKFPFNWVMW